MATSLKNISETICDLVSGSKKLSTFQVLLDVLQNDTSNDFVSIEETLIGDIEIKIHEREKYALAASSTRYFDSLSQKGKNAIPNRGCVRSSWDDTAKAVRKLNTTGILSTNTTSQKKGKSGVWLLTNEFKNLVGIPKHCAKEDLLPLVFKFAQQHGLRNPRNTCQRTCEGFAKDIKWTLNMRENDKEFAFFWEMFPTIKTYILNRFCHNPLNKATMKSALKSNLTSEEIGNLCGLEPQFNKILQEEPLSEILTELLVGVGINAEKHVVARQDQEVVVADIITQALIKSGFDIDALASELSQEVEMQQHDQQTQQPGQLCQTWSPMELNHAREP